MDPVTLTFIALLVFSITGHVGLEWWQVVAMYVALVALAWMTDSGEEPK